MVKVIVVHVKRVALKLPQFVGKRSGRGVTSSEFGGQEASGFGSVLHDGRLNAGAVGKHGRLYDYLTYVGATSLINKTTCFTTFRCQNKMDHNDFSNFF